MHAALDAVVREATGRVEVRNVRRQWCDATEKRSNCWHFEYAFYAEFYSKSYLHGVALNDKQWRSAGNTAL